MGVVVAFLGLLGYAATDAHATACRNSIISALDNSQCTTATFWHDIGGWAIAAGLGLLALGLYINYKQGKGEDGGQ